MKANWGNASVDVYPVESFIYEVVANGKKEFYQSAWDAFESNLHMNNSTARIIKIPVVPMSDSEVRAEAVAFTLGKKRDYPEKYIVEFHNKPNQQQNTSKPKTKKNVLDYLWVILAVICWIFAIWGLIT